MKIYDDNIEEIFNKMVFSRYTVAIRCYCGLTNLKSISTSSSSTILSRFSQNKSNRLIQDENKRFINYSTLANEHDVIKIEDKEPLKILPNNFEQDIENCDFLTDFKHEVPQALDTCVDDLSHIGPSFPVSFNFAAYANKSPMIQRLAELGVDFSKIEKRNGIAQYLLPLDFEKDMKLHIRFLNDCGVPPDELGRYLTKNPLIFKEDLDDLYTRIRYLSAHKFERDMIARIVTKNPYWVMFSTKRIDTRLGFFQKEFNLSGDEIRNLATKQPRLITYKLEHVKENTFAVREEMGFDKQETKQILMAKPRIWMKNRKLLVECFDYIHNQMKLPHETIAQQPEVLTCRLHKLKQRHMFLVTQKKAQYDPTKPLYVSLKALISNTDAEFCANVAKTPVETFNMFLKTL